MATEQTDNARKLQTGCCGMSASGGPDLEAASLEGRWFNCPAIVVQFTAVRRAQVTFIMKHTGVDTKEGRPSRRNIRVSLPEMNPPERAVPV